MRFTVFIYLFFLRKYKGIFYFFFHIVNFGKLIKNLENTSHFMIKSHYDALLHE